jgi:hypothetical protein
MMDDWDTYISGIKINKMGSTFNKGQWNPVHGDNKSTARGVFRTKGMETTTGEYIIQIEFDRNILFLHNIVKISPSIELVNARKEHDKIRGIQETLSDEKQMRMNQLKGMISRLEAIMERDQTKAVIDGMRDGFAVCPLMPTLTNFVEMAKYLVISDETFAVVSLARLSCFC